jgi:hypothetical protein
MTLVKQNTFHYIVFLLEIAFRIKCFAIRFKRQYTFNAENTPIKAEKIFEGLQTERDDQI